MAEGGVGGAEVEEGGEEGPVLVETTLEALLLLEQLDLEPDSLPMDSFLVNQACCSNSFCHSSN